MQDPATTTNKSAVSFRIQLELLLLSTLYGEKLVRLDYVCVRVCSVHSVQLIASANCIAKESRNVYKSRLKFCMWMWNLRLFSVLVSVRCYPRNSLALNSALLVGHHISRSI